MVVEQPAVEPVDQVGPEIAAVLHGGEQLAGHRLETLRPGDAGFQHPLEQAGRQDAGIFREHAEKQLVHEVGDAVRFKAAYPELLGQRREILGGFAGDGLAGDAGAEQLDGFRREDGL